MAPSSIYQAVFILACLSSVHGQYFDFFQALQPYIQTQPSQQYNLYNEFTTRRPKPKQRPSNTDIINSSQHIRKTASEQNDKRRKQTEVPFDTNFFTTTVKPVRKTTKVNTQQKPQNQQSKVTNSRPVVDSKVTNNFGNNRETGAIYFEDDPRNRPLSSGSRAESSSSHRDRPTLITGLENAGRQTTTTPRPTKKNQPIVAYDSTNNNDGSNSFYYTTKGPFYETTKLYQQNNRDTNSNKNYYTTHNPVSQRPGVRPLVVNGPPITNRPVTVRPDFGQGSVTDASPEIITGPDEDNMTAVEKKRYIDIAERMCEKYKSLNIKKVQAIPLVPSPHAVEVNVTSCAPNNVPLIVGGRVVKIEEFPHMALLGWRKVKSRGYSWKCGGTLLSNQYILTAGHCAYQDRDDNVIAGPPRVVQLGSSFLDDPKATVARIATVIRHPKYKQPKAYYDLAIIKTASSVSFSDTIKPACMGVPPRPGQPIIATGWGKTEFGGSQSQELRSVSVPVWTLNDCYTALGVSTKLPTGPSSDSQICAGSGGKDTCQGDSGGPAQTQDGCMWRVVAVTSVGRACGSAETPAIYATVQRPFVSAVVFANEQPANNNRNQQTGNDQRNDKGQTVNSGRETINNQIWNTNKNTQATSTQRTDTIRGQTTNNNKRNDDWNTNINNQATGSQRTDDYSRDEANNERTDTFNNKRSQQATNNHRSEDHNSRGQTNQGTNDWSNNKNVQQTSSKRNDGKDQTNNNQRPDSWNNNKNIQQGSHRSDEYNDQTFNNNRNSNSRNPTDWDAQTTNQQNNNFNQQNGNRQQATGRLPHNNQGSNWNTQRDTNNYYNYNTQTEQYNRDPKIQNGFYSPEGDYYSYPNRQTDTYGTDRGDYYGDRNVWWT